MLMKKKLKTRSAPAVGNKSVFGGAGCVLCTDYLARAVREAGAAEGQVRDAIAIPLEVRTNTASILVAMVHGNTDGEYPGLEFYLGKAQEAGATNNQSIQQPG